MFEISIALFLVWITFPINNFCRIIEAFNLYSKHYRYIKQVIFTRFLPLIQIITSKFWLGFVSRTHSWVAPSNSWGNFSIFELKFVIRKVESWWIDNPSMGRLSSTLKLNKQLVDSIHCLHCVSNCSLGHFLVFLIFYEQLSTFSKSSLAWLNSKGV